MSFVSTIVTLFWFDVCECFQGNADGPVGGVKIKTEPEDRDSTHERDRERDKSRDYDRDRDRESRHRLVKNNILCVMCLREKLIILNKCEI